jgi:hypothetical protein
MSYACVRTDLATSDTARGNTMYIVGTRGSTLVLDNAQPSSQPGS